MTSGDSTETARRTRVRAIVRRAAPWMALSLALLITNIATGWSLVRARADAAVRHEAARFSMVSPLRALVPHEHFLTTLEPLRSNIRDLVAAAPLRVSVYLEFLNTGANININQDYRFWPASLAKVPIAIATMKTVEGGAWTRNKKLVLADEDRTSVSSALYRAPAGSSFSVEQLLQALLTQSDNTAYKLLLRNLPRQQIAAMQEAIGLDELFDSTGKISGKEYARFFRTLYSASYLSESGSQYLLEIMNRADYKWFLKASIPDFVLFPHKWGAFPQDHTYGDAGIVYVPNRPYLLAVLVQGNGSPDEVAMVQRIMQEISGMAYVYFANTL